MKSAIMATRTKMIRRTAVSACSISLSLLIGSSTISAQVRTKRPDRGIYRPGPASVEPERASSGNRGVSSPSEVSRGATDADERPPTSDIVHPIRLEPLPSMTRNSLHSVVAEPVGADRAGDSDEYPPAEIEPVSYQRSRPAAPQRNRSSQFSGPQRSSGSGSLSPSVETGKTYIQNGRMVQHAMPDAMMPSGMRAGEIWTEGETYIDGGPLGYQESYMDDDGYGCDSCDSSGCDGMGCDNGRGYGQGLSNGALSFDPDRWFGSLELLLLWRKGDLVPPLITTSPSGTLFDDAGQLPRATVLAGGENLFDRMTAGGRVSVGTWIDSCRDRSIVARLWTATEEDYSLNRSEGINSGGILAIPTTLANSPNAAVIAFPDTSESSGRFGSVDLSASSNVYGGDVSVRQYWTGGLGTSYDVLYGYQYMRLDEDLSLRTSSTLTQPSSPLAIGDNLSTADSVDTSNQFHGGLFGLAGQYREGCWSFDFLAKVAFGQVRRDVQRRGQSIIRSGTSQNVQDSGIVITDGNSGSFNDNTFGWVPELDVSLGWHRYPRFDVTFGYNLIAMTDTVRLSGALDPFNTVDNPRAGLNDDTFFLQGLHFGIRHVY